MTVLLSALFTTLSTTAIGKALDRLFDAGFARADQVLGEPVPHALAVRLHLAPDLSPAGRTLAWTTFVQLTTRISVVPMGEKEGFDREALASLHTMFGELRDALILAGPEAVRELARPGAIQAQGGSATTVATVVQIVLNVALRPFLNHWHPLLERREAQRPAGSSAWVWEQDWPDHPRFRHELRELQGGLREVAIALQSLLDIQGIARVGGSGRKGVKVGQYPAWSALRARGPAEAR